MLERGQRVRIRVWSKDSGWNGEPELWEVVEPDYGDAFGPLFTGLVVRGKHEGKVLAGQIKHIIGMEPLPA